MRVELRRHPSDLDARFQLARALAWQQRYKEAMAQYSRLLRARPGNADFLLGMAQANFWSGDAKRALPLLKKARALVPEYEDVWRTEIQVRLALADPVQLACARRVRDQARSRFPGKEWGYAQLDAPPSATVAVAAPLVVESAAPAAAAELPLVARPVPAATAAAVPPPDRYEWEAGYSYESLTRGLPSWRSAYFLAERHLPDKASLYLGLRETQRYALRDKELNLGGVLPLTADMQVQIEAGLSGTHRVLPARYGLVHWLYRPAPNWAVDAGMRRSVFDVGMSRVAHLGIDRYVGSERFNYTLYEGGPDGSGLAPSHRLQWAHYYGVSDWVGLTVSRGRESENVGATGFLTSDVSGVMLSGRHSFAADWSLSWDAGRLRQGDFYTRSGIRLGLRHAY